MSSTIRLCGKYGIEIPAGAPEEGCPGFLLEAALDAAGGQVVFGRYTLVELLGGGGIGIVWLARDKGTTRSHDYRRPRRARQIGNRRAHVQRSIRLAPEGSRLKQSAGSPSSLLRSAQVKFTAKMRRSCPPRGFGAINILAIACDRSGVIGSAIIRSVESILRLSSS